MKCPRCGQDADLVGLPNQDYPAAYRCSNRHGEYTFSADNAESRRECAASRALSVSNAGVLARAGSYMSSPEKSVADAKILGGIPDDPGHIPDPGAAIEPT